MHAYEFDSWRLERRAQHDVWSWATSTREGIRIIDLPTSYVRVRVAGHGRRTIVFPCDMPNVVENHDEIFRLLQNDYRVVSYEQPGFGFSYPKRGFDFSRRAYADVLAALLAALGPGPYTLAAPCVSTFYALQVAREHPEWVDSLVLMQATTWQRQCEWARLVMDRFALVAAFLPFVGEPVTRTPGLGQLLYAGIEPKFARRTHRHAIHRSRQRPELFRQIVQPLYAAFEHGACNCMASAYQRYFDPSAQIPPVTQPALILWASADMSHQHSDSRGLLRYAPRAHWQEIPDTGHHLEVENAKAVASAITSWQSSIGLCAAAS
jgi:pimeloyl-ACP methyl ester carboxylesterase